MRTAAIAVAATSAVAVRKMLERTPSGWPGSSSGDPNRWRAVTINRPIEEIGSDVPAPLEEFGEAVEVRLTPAPGDKGSELAARIRPGEKKPSIDDLRRALRVAKQMLEIGYVLEPDGNTTTQPTALNVGLRKATENAPGEGRL